MMMMWEKFPHISLRTSNSVKIAWKTQRAEDFAEPCYTGLTVNHA